MTSPVGIFTSPQASPIENRKKNTEVSIPPALVLGPILGGASYLVGTSFELFQNSMLTARNLDIFSQEKDLSTFTVEKIREIAVPSLQIGINTPFVEKKIQKAPLFLLPSEALLKSIQLNQLGPISIRSNKNRTNFLARDKIRSFESLYAEQKESSGAQLRQRRILFKEDLLISEIVRSLGKISQMVSSRDISLQAQMEPQLKVSDFIDVFFANMRQIKALDEKNRIRKLVDFFLMKIEALSIEWSKNKESQKGFAPPCSSLQKIYYPKYMQPRLDKNDFVFAIGANLRSRFLHNYKWENKIKELLNREIITVLEVFEEIVLTRKLFQINPTFLLMTISFISVCFLAETDRKCKIEEEKAQKKLDEAKKKWKRIQEEANRLGIKLDNS